MERDNLKAVFTQAASCGWSAESTSQLQEWLEKFSENVKTKADDVKTMLDQLSRRTSEVEEQLYNTFNSFRLLSNRQFIENRVYDEDETSSSSDVQAPQKPGTYEAVISPNEALLMALEAHQAVLKSSRFKAARSKRFPYVIGTEEFSRDPFCGLVERTVVEDYDSEVEKDGANMAAQMVGTGQNLSEADSIGDVSENEQDGEPAVSAALDFKSMLEAALRAPYVPYDTGSASYFSMYEQDTAKLAGAFDRDILGHKDVEGVSSLSPETSAHVPTKQEVADLVQRDATVPGSSRPTVSDELFLPFSNRPVQLTPGESSTTSSKIWDLLGSPKATGPQDEQQASPGSATGSEPVETKREAVPTDVNVSTRTSVRPPAARLSEDEDESTSWSSDIEVEEVEDQISSQHGSQKPPTGRGKIDEEDHADRAAVETDDVSSTSNSTEMHKDLETQDNNDIFSKHVFDGQSHRTSNLSALLFGSDV